MAFDPRDLGPSCREQGDAVEAAQKTKSVDRFVAQKAAQRKFLEEERAEARKAFVDGD